MTKCSASDVQDQKRLVITVNRRGNVLTVNPGASKSLFGFNPTELVGRSLSSFLNSFDQWKAKYGEDASLLLLLCKMAGDLCDDSWRVGIRNPKKDQEEAARKQSGGKVIGMPRVLTLGLAELLHLCLAILEI